jgi:hypothetical protein
MVHLPYSFNEFSVIKFSFYVSNAYCAFGDALSERGLVETP